MDAFIGSKKHAWEGGEIDSSFIAVCLLRGCTKFKTDAIVFLSNYENLTHVHA